MRVLVAIGLVCGLAMPAARSMARQERETKSVYGIELDIPPADYTNVFVAPVGGDRVEVVSRVYGKFRRYSVQSKDRACRVADGGAVDTIGVKYITFALAGENNTLVLCGEHPKSGQDGFVIVTQEGSSWHASDVLEGVREYRVLSVGYMSGGASMAVVDLRRGARTGLWGFVCHDNGVLHCRIPVKAGQEYLANVSRRVTVVHNFRLPL